MKKKILMTLSIILILCMGGFGIYVNDYYHAQNDALEILNHKNVEKVNSNLITLTPEKKSDVGIIFYPGAKVENTAYLPLLKHLTNKGYNCFLLKMPFNMAIFNKNAANKIINQYPNIKHWYICGHSMGGAMASSYVSKNKYKVDGLILLGSYIYGDVSDKDALTIYGSLNTSVKKKIDYKRNIVVIKGGNHANFGNYGHQKGDAKATISRKEQQNQTVKAINNFIEKRLN